MKAPLATPRARALAAALRDARESRGIAQRELARQLGMTHPLLSHWERGMRLPKVEEVAAILGCLHVHGMAKERILDLARNAGEANWVGQDSVPGVPLTLTALVEFERTAAAILAWNPMLIPGLAQTAGYARAIFERGPLPSSEVESRMTIRLDRRSVLVRRDAPKLTMLIGEAALHQGIGGAGVMADQLRYLLTTSKSQHISVQIVPAGNGWHPGLTGPFVIYDFEGLPSIVLVENHRASAYLYDEGHVASYKTAATFVQDLAMSEPDSLALIAGVITELEATA